MTQIVPPTPFHAIARRAASYEFCAGPARRAAVNILLDTARQRGVHMVRIQFRSGLLCCVRVLGPALLSREAVAVMASALQPKYGSPESTLSYAHVEQAAARALHSLTGFRFTVSILHNALLDASTDLPSQHISRFLRAAPRAGIARSCLAPEVMAYLDTLPRRERHIAHYNRLLAGTPQASKNRLSLLRVLPFLQKALSAH
ncbi:hypothetical protein [Massilia sp. TS11]|uniref:hypothetical protein n=1 Tax=Massilia sp. TS11 TaxID=2908003 RepID=UPI001EDB846C|nr:hypothetical protein [Massilia sp. TS11]MCG2586800.1 hypothetical protein [Massilia sp. TS11]